MDFHFPNPRNPRPRLAAFALIGLGLFALINLGVSRAFSGHILASPAAKPTPAGVSLDDQAALEKEIEAAIEQADEVLAYQIFEVQIDRIEISMDGSWAQARLLLKDLETRQVIPTEPGLALAQKVGGEWQVYLQSEPDWADSLRQLPKELLSPAAKDSWLIQLDAHLEAPENAPYTGYLLPWAGGLQKFLTRSISHGINGSMHYAFDFAQPGYPSAMFAIHASKGGTVKYAVWGFPNGYDDGNCGNSNFLVLEHAQTTPPTYTLYMHLAQESIPQAFRTPGAAVLQGEYIGMADDTGCSSGNHLHLQTHTNPYSYWGTSVDIIFSDVPINGGRPRTVNEALAYPQYGAQGQDLYLSANSVPTDTSLPVGTITAPALGAAIPSGSVNIAGTASDSGSGLSHYQVVAKYGGLWHDVGPVHMAAQFTQTWDMCAAGVPDGPVSLALNLWDNEGNLASLSGIRHFIKNYACPQPPPACSPGPNQVALYAEAEFKGDCSTLDAGAYPDALSFGAVGDDRAASIQVGSNLAVTLYSGPGFAGRSETLVASDRDLAGNPIGARALSSLRTRARTALPLVPVPGLPAGGAAFTTTASLDFSWRDGGGGLEYQVEVSGPAPKVSPWLRGTSWSAGSLVAGGYTWRVRARNPNGVSGWTAGRDFEVASAAPGPATPIPVPYSEGFESSSGWASSGLWHRLADAASARSGTYSFWYGSDGSGNYDTGSPNAGDLTSPPLQIPGAGYAARFWYRYETESNETHWDQRWVQVSVDGGPFENVLQLADDEALVWLQSPPVDLSAYAGKTVRLRLHFTTLDAVSNARAGWWIDDFSVAASLQPACADPNEPNNSPETASSIGYAQVRQGQICPAGDRDFYAITGVKGDRVVIDINAQSQGSALDPYLFLLAADGSTVLASSDDEVLGVLLDPHLGYVFPENGTYYLKVRAWDHPGAGGVDSDYTIRMDLDGVDPSLDLSGPATGTYLPDTTLTLSANATDSASGVSRVEFWWHGSDWLGGDWELLATDRDGADGWSVEFDPGARPEGAGLALYAVVYDWAGNTAGRGVWELGIDRTAPQTTLTTLPPTLDTTAIGLAWQGTDNVSGIETFDLQSDRDLEGWQDFQTGLPAGQKSAWFIGEPGRLYSFRVRATDKAGNVEAYPPDGDTVTYIRACTSPDAWEPDDQPGQAASLAVGGAPQSHNLCALGDKDWVRFAAAAGEHYRIFARPTHPSSAVTIRVYNSNGASLLAEATPRGFGDWTILQWDAPHTGEFTLRLSHLNELVAGAAVSYEIYILNGYAKYIPVVEH